MVCVLQGRILVLANLAFSVLMTMAWFRQWFQKWERRWDAAKRRGRRRLSSLRRALPSAAPTRAKGGGPSAWHSVHPEPLSGIETGIETGGPRLPPESVLEAASPGAGGGDAAASRQPGWYLQPRQAWGRQLLPRHAECSIFQPD